MNGRELVALAKRVMADNPGFAADVLSWPKTERWRSEPKLEQELHPDIKRIHELADEQNVVNWYYRREREHRNRKR